MATSAGKISVSFVGDTTNLDKSIASAQRSLTNFGNKMKKIGSNMTKFVTLPILGIGAAMVKSASDAAETHSKFTTVFKGIGDKAQQMAKTLADSYIMSNEESERLLSNTGDLLTGFGFTKDAAADLSFEVQKLAADLASFNNVPVKQASEAVTKALLGERESLKTLGIAIRESDVKQKLLEKGQQDLTGQALLAAKAQATFELAMQQSGNAIGDVAETSDSFANRMKRMRADVADLSVQLGQELLPLAKQMLEKGIQLVKWFKDLSKEQKQNIIKWGLIVAAVGPLLTIFGNLITTMTSIIRLSKGLITGIINIAKSFSIAKATTLGWITVLASAVIFMEGFSKKGKDGLSIFDHMALRLVKLINLFSGYANIMVGNTKYGEKFLKNADDIGKGLDALSESGRSMEDVFKDAVQSGIDEFGNLADAVGGSIGDMLKDLLDFGNIFEDTKKKVSKLEITAEMNWDNPNLGEEMPTMKSKGIEIAEVPSGTAGFTDTITKANLAAQTAIGQTNQALTQQMVIAQQLGKPFDDTAATLDAYTQTYMDLISQGISPASEKMQQLARDITDLTDKQIENIATTQAQERAQYAVQDAMLGLGDIMGGAFGDMITGTKTVGEAFKSMAIDILKMVANIATALIIQNALQSASGTGVAAFFTTPVFIAAGVAMIASLFANLMSSFAVGGMTMGPTLAMIGDNPSGKEAVIPFERMGEFIDMVSPNNNSQQVVVLDAKIRGDDILLTSNTASEKRSALF